MLRVIPTYKQQPNTIQHIDLCFEKFIILVQVKDYPCYVAKTPEGGYAVLPAEHLGFPSVTRADYGHSRYSCKTLQELLDKLHKNLNKGGPRTVNEVVAVSRDVCEVYKAYDWIRNKLVNNGWH